MYNVHKNVTILSPVLFPFIPRLLHNITVFVNILTFLLLLPISSHLYHSSHAAPHFEDNATADHALQETCRETRAHQATTRLTRY